MAEFYHLYKGITKEVVNLKVERYFDIFTRQSDTTNFPDTARDLWKFIDFVRFGDRSSKTEMICYQTQSLYPPKSSKTGCDLLN